VEQNSRLAFFLPNLGGGGAERVALALMEGFLDQGYEIDLVLSEQQGTLLPLVPKSVEIFDLKASKLRKSIVPLARYLGLRRPWALHAMMWPLPLLAVAARGIAGVDTRIIGSEHTTLSTMPHGLANPVVRLLTRKGYQRLDELIAVSTGVADDLAKFIGLDRNQISTIYNPLSLPKCLPDPAAARQLWPANTKRILAVGALKREKNYPLLLRSLSRVCETTSSSLLILGDGPLRGELEAMAIELGLRERVIFFGFGTDPWPYYSAADLFVLSSDFEGFGNVLVEALHAGLPIVSTNCPNGPAEILDMGNFGRLVPCNDEKALAEAMIEEMTEKKFNDSAVAWASSISGHERIDDHLKKMIG
jgi:glycosyltransferase involved in cell wall biosynthesis